MAGAAFETELAGRFRLVAMDLPGIGLAPLQPGIKDLDADAELVAEVTLRLSDGHVVIVAHSVSSILASKACQLLGEAASGTLSIEGNLTSADAYLSCMASQFENVAEFKTFFLDCLLGRGRTEPLFRRYRQAAERCDATALWYLGRAAREPGEMPGDLLLSLRYRKLYVYCSDNLPSMSREWLMRHPQMPTFELVAAS